MAKDPAFLFYPGDWLGGTMTMTRAHKGAYMDLLMCQFNQGRMTLEDIKAVLNSDFNSMWETKLKAKFKCENGLYYNEKLELEVKKRRNFTESRKQNLEKRDLHKHTHMVTHMENENEDVNEIKDERRNLSIKERKILFSDSEYFEFDKFRVKILEDEKYKDFNLQYYHEALKNWSAEGNRKLNWIATAKNWMLRDYKEKKTKGVARVPVYGVI